MEKLLDEIKESLKQAGIEEEKDTPRRMPFIAVRGLVVFPHTTMYIDIGRERSLSALQRAMMLDQRLVMVTQRNIGLEEPTIDQMYTVGCTVRVRHIVPGEEEETVRLVCEGEERVLLVGLTEMHGCEYAEFLPMPSPEPAAEDADQIAAYAQRVKSLFAELCRARGRASGEQLQIIEGESDSRVLADLAAANGLRRVADKQQVLEARDLLMRLKLLVKFLQREIELAELERSIDQTVRERMSQQQREYYLREQLGVIHEELGDGAESEIERLRKLIASKPAMNAEAKEKAERELNRLSRMQQGTPEATVSQNYVEWLAEMPWGKYTKANVTLPAARRVLESEHYGLEKVKERIVEFLAVRMASTEMHAPILCLVGPPGVGKTSIAQSVAHALKRKFIRVALGGVHDEAELRGHRRTYIGAQPGRVVTSIRQCGVMNPVFLFDEIDKMASDFRGDPASAMLEVLDPAQNATFTDHFLDVPLDLSQVLFITTANSAEDIPQPLYDRMEIIEVPSYTLEEKVQIARRHLWPRQLKEHGLKKSQLHITDGAIAQVIERYTREAGVRELERELGAICRKAVVRRLEEGEEAKSLSVKEDGLEPFLGVPRFIREDVLRAPEVGVVNGLAWTQAGGTVMPIEVLSMPGAGKVDLTGRLGEVMQESARTALSYIRAHADSLGIPADFYKERDLHVHVPEGAVPKDGPSAGVALTCAMVSCLSGRPARQDVAMTGEVTLLGRVLPIGGVKEKLLAAHRLGVETVLLPAGNEKDLADLPENVREKMDIRLIGNVSQALEIVLVKEEGE